jgi:hypothetical protein
MTLQIDTITGNKRLSAKLDRMLLDLRSNTGAWLDSIEEIKQQAHKEGFNEQETHLLIKQYLSGFLEKRQIRWILDEKPRRLEQKKLSEKLATSGTDANMSIAEPEPETVSIPADYEVLVPDQVLEEETKQLEQQEQPESEPVNEVLEEKIIPNYEVEDLKLQLDNANSKITELTTQNKNIVEKYMQLETRIRVSPSNNFPAIQGNILRTKIVVNKMFREILVLKGSKEIYANILIDVSQNKYVGLEHRL